MTTPSAVAPPDVSPSPNNTFMGLMSHLQTMELQLTSVLMEATMKIAAMIDANVFIMVESSGQRYFSGRKYLIESYLNNCLGPSSNDVELEIYPEVCALQEKSTAGSHQHGNGGSSSTPNHHHHHSPHGPSAYPTSPPSHHPHSHHQQNHHHRPTPHHPQPPQHHSHHNHHSPSHHRSQQQQHHQHHEASRRSRKRSSPASSSTSSSHYGDYMRSKGGVPTSSTPKKLRTEIAASLKLEAEGGGGGGGAGNSEMDDIAVIDEEAADGEFAGDGGASYQVSVNRSLCCCCCCSCSSSLFLLLFYFLFYFTYFSLLLLFLFLSVLCFPRVLPVFLHSFPRLTFFLVTP